MGVAKQIAIERTRPEGAIKVCSEAAALAKPETGGVAAALESDVLATQRAPIVAQAVPEDANVFLSLFRRTGVKSDAFYAQCEEALSAQDVYDISDLVELNADALLESLETAGNASDV